VVLLVAMHYIVVIRNQGFGGPCCLHQPWR